MLLMEEIQYSLNLSNNILFALSVCLAVDFLLITVIGLFLYRKDLEDKILLQAKGDVDCMGKLPLVIVQLPMYNEREVFHRIIAAACLLDWPKDRLIVQVLDDSTDEVISESVRSCVQEWKNNGVDVRYRKRISRKGFKAGNLQEGMSEGYAQKCDYVAILDADFEPSPDWLRLTIPYLESDPGLALVQTRWTFCNSSESYLTRWQEIELKWHFLAEQLSGSHLMGYFGFNGTAGIWRVSSILESGSWSGDTLTEDMDMALSAASRGWRFLMLPHVECSSELPSTLSAYRKQQYRWACGPAALLRKHWNSLWEAQACKVSQRAFMLLVYIGLRRVLRPLLTVAVLLQTALALLCPSLFPLPLLSLSALLLAQPLCVFAFSIRQLHLLPSYVAFTASLSLMRSRAVFAGLCNLSSSHRWVVTKKTGVALVTGKDKLDG